jgi:hypothetical protein
MTAHAFAMSTLPLAPRLLAALIRLDRLVRLGDRHRGEQSNCRERGYCKLMHLSKFLHFVVLLFTLID